MDRREFLKVAGASAIWLSLAGCGDGLSSSGRKPNIVLIMADDLGYETLGAYGGTSYATPVLDDLAANSLRFDHAYSQPICTASRVKIMTGLYNHRNYEAFGILPPGQTTFAHLLSEAGYSTCVIGKWQLYGSEFDPPEDRGRGTRPEDAGFDEHCVWQVERANPRHRNPLIVRNGSNVQTTGDSYGPDIFAEFGIEFIKRQGNDPFLLYHPMVLPHAPFEPTPAHPDWETADGTEDDPIYFKAQVEYMDEIVGRIIDALSEAGVRRDTLVLFTGDNGSPPQVTSTANGEEIVGGKRKSTDGGTHVPLIANWPGTIAAGSTEALIDFSDMLPTMVDLAGIEPPIDSDGHSFAGALTGGAYQERDWIVVWYDHRQGGTRWFTRDRRWKLYNDGRLYDVPADTLEEEPIPPGASPEADAARARLQAVLDSLV